MLDREKAARSTTIHVVSGGIELNLLGQRSPVIDTYTHFGKFQEALTREFSALVDKADETIKKLV